jgi:hypothetical protein
VLTLPLIFKILNCVLWLSVVDIFFVLLQAAEEPVDDLMDLVKQIIPFHVKVIYGITSYCFVQHFCISTRFSC